MPFSNSPMKRGARLPTLGSLRRLSSSAKKRFSTMLDSENCIQSLQTRGAALIKIHDVSKRDQRPDQTRQIQIEHRKLTDRDLAAHRGRHARPYDDDVTEPEKKRHQRTHQRLN